MSEEETVEVTIRLPKQVAEFLKGFVKHFGGDVNSYVAVCIRSSLRRMLKFTFHHYNVLDTDGKILEVDHE